jgi:ATP-dependent Lon protease
MDRIKAMAAALSDGDDINVEDEQNRGDTGLPEQLPVLPLRNTVLFPGVVIPITVAREKSIRGVKHAHGQKDRLICVVTQKSVDVEEPMPGDLYGVGTLAAILKMLRMPDGSITVIIQGRTRVSIGEYTQTDPFFVARIEAFPEIMPPPDKTRALMLSMRNEASKIIELNPNIPSEAAITLQNIPTLSFLANFILSNLNMEAQAKQEMLEESRLEEKAKKVLQLLAQELQVLELTEDIQSRVRFELDKQQRDYILRQQIKTIQDELGDQSFESEIDELRKRASGKRWPEHAAAAFEKELSKLYRYPPNSPEQGVTQNYIDWLLELPWGQFTRDKFNLKSARNILEAEHYGLEKVKERIIEYLAVLKLRKDLKAPILCFVGPPGVGKTSLGKSIAHALGRKFVRMSLGGVRDESEIRGHRRTYIGSMPGRILQGLKKAQSGNPVFVLDEIDKVGNDFRGDPASALLEVLDPEQNHAFNDHYLELDYDLSTVMFIATANTLDTLHPALRDRMEIIEISGYTMEEKVQIAVRHLIPKLKKEHGLKEHHLRVAEEEIRTIIEGYTRESGVRALSQKLAAVCRGVAKEVVEKNVKTVVLTPDVLLRYLGVPRYESEMYQTIDRPGVAVGMAWTSYGGEILFIETALTPGTGKLSLTGQLGEVMKESAQAAHIYLKANAQRFGIEPDIFMHWDAHIHIPAGAIPKDGPSAGITMLTAMAGAFSQRCAKPGMAMTGEITLRGKVLPVGGIKEKLLAATRAGIRELIFCKANQKDVEEIPEIYRKDLTIHYVDKMDDVLDLALEKEPIEHPLNLKAYMQATNESTPRYAPVGSPQAIALPVRLSTSQ